MKALKCKPSAQFAYNYSINVLSKCISIISHRSSIFEGRHIDHRRSTDTSTIDPRRLTHRSSIFESRHIDLRRSTHRSSKESRHIDHRSLKVDISIFEGRHIDCRSSKFDTVTHRSSIFEGRHIDLQRSTH